MRSKARQHFLCITFSCCAKKVTTDQTNATKSTPRQGLFVGRAFEPPDPTRRGAPSKETASLDILRLLLHRSWFSSMARRTARPAPVERTTSSTTGLYWSRARELLRVAPAHRKSAALGIKNRLASPPEPADVSIEPDCTLT